MVDTNILQVVVFVSVVAGAFGRTMLPYLQKLKEAEEGEKPVFQHKYFFTMLYSLAISLGLSLTLFSSVLASVPTDAALSSVMIIAGLTGWGANSVVNGITSNVHAEDVKREISRLKKTEGSKGVSKEGGVQIGDKTIS
jgi:hypothetical protein